MINEYTSNQLGSENVIERRIISSFMDLYAELPIEQISVRKITQQAELNRGTFYLHYKDIYDLRDQIIKQFEDMCRIIAKNTSAVLFSNKTITSVLPKSDFYTGNLKYLKILLAEKGKSNLQQTMKDELKKNICLQYHLMNDMQSDLKELALEFLVSAQVAVILKWLQNDLKTSMQDVSDLIQDLTNNGFKKYLTE
jgi:AcrR family transcriptional regulator